MRAKEFITEIFDLTNPPRTDWKATNNGVLGTWTDKTGATVITGFRRQGNTVDVSFNRTDAQGALTLGRANNAGSASSSVFAGVAANLKDYLKANPNITHVTFGASDDPARSQLYAKMAQRAGVLGLELVDPKDLANIPPEIRQQSKDRVYTRAVNKIPTLPTPGSKNTVPPYTQKYDQFVLKRQGVQTAPKQAVAPNRAGDEYTNVYGAKPTASNDQQYLKDLTALQRQFPTDANLSAELSAQTKRVPQP
jgi:hypothetical protein